jgi:hypothetical protein
MYAEAKMLNMMKRDTVDLLVEQFWKQGYMTISRKYGTYLPEPSKVGNFEVDIIAKQKKNYAIGITITGDDLNDPGIVEKINYLATRQTKYTNKKVMLFMGAEVQYYKNAKALVDDLDPETRKNIRLFQILERPLPVRRRNRDFKKVLFS